MNSDKDWADQLDDDDPSVEQIRDILFDRESLVDRISNIFTEALEKRVAQSQQEVSHSFSPVINDAIRYQIRQSHSEFVDAIYPIVGQAVTKSITQAIRNLLKQIDARLQKSTSPTYLWQSWQAQLKGIPQPAYVLRGAVPFFVREAFLIQRESGLLICHYAEPGEASEDRDLVGGMLTAIRDFARDAFGQGRQGELGAIEYESQNIILEAGRLAYLAVVVEGVEPSSFRQVLQDRLTRLHQTYYDSLFNFDGSDEQLAQAALDELTALSDAASYDDFDSPERPITTSQKIILAILATIAVTLLCLPVSFCAWWVWRVESVLLEIQQTPTTQVVTATAPPPTETAPPTSTPTHTATPTPPPTETPTATYTLTPSATPTPLPLPTETPTPPPTETPTLVPTETPTPTPTETPTITPTPTPSILVNGTVSASILNFRAAPGLQSNIQIVLNAGEPLTAIGRSADQTWANVYLTSGDFGWVYTPYVRWGDDLSQLPVTSP